MAISRLRFNVLPLNDNLYRYSESAQKRNCTFCKSKTVVENDYHLLYDCPISNDLGKNILKDVVNEPINELLKLKTDCKTVKLSKYIFRAMSRRKSLTAE